ncbi:hypothetical protein D6C80_01366 [Aureobasidium pullulans]|nr:hypothetical protein D6C80_01366 [Aureobasidium pullulans]
MAQFINQPHRNSYPGAPQTTMDLPYQQIYQPVEENHNMQSLFEPQPPPQYYGFPPPTGSSLDSGYAEDSNPFEVNNMFCPDFKVAFGQNVNSTAPNFGAYCYMTNDQQPSGREQNFMPIGFSAPFQQNFGFMKQNNNVSQSPPALIMDDAVSVKSEDASSDAASPKTTTFQDSQLRKQTRKRPGTLKRMATDTSIEGRPSVERSTTKESRGRNKKRIPHTAVERRYRENLNLHLEKLRLAVPNLQAAHRRRASDVNDPMKPSKCEVLMGAVEYIKRLESEVARLKKEVGE